MKPIQNYLYCIFSNLLPAYPIYLLLFEYKGLSLSQISLLLMIWSVPVVLLELPSGILADRWSRKNLLLISTFLHAACFAVWLFSEGFLGFAVGFIFWGISEALSSGAREAVLFDSLKKAGTEENFDRIFGRGEMLGRVSIAVAMVLGGILSEIGGFALALSVSALSLLLGSVIVLGFHEVNIFRESLPEKAMIFDKQGLGALRDAASFLFGSPLLLLPVLLSILVVGMYGILDEYDPAVAELFVPGVFFVALWGTARFVAEGLGDEFFPRLKRFLQARFGINTIHMILFLSVLGSVSLLFFSLLKSAALIPFYALYFTVGAGIQVLIEDHVQHKVELQGRSTVHSLAS
ncbi:MAG: MFS transporter [Clostridiales bacterium]|nr:MFS transporter [Clostridiales bacterium]